MDPVADSIVTRQIEASRWHSLDTGLEVGINWASVHSMLGGSALLWLLQGQLLQLHPYPRPWWHSPSPGKSQVNLQLSPDSNPISCYGRGGSRGRGAGRMKSRNNRLHRRSNDILTWKSQEAGAVEAYANFTQTRCKWTCLCLPLAPGWGSMTNPNGHSVSVWLITKASWDDNCTLFLGAGGEM